MIAALAIVRWFHEIALMALFGSAALGALLRLSLPSSQLGMGLRQSAVLVALTGALLWFVLAAIQMTGGLDDHGLWLALTQSLFGQVFMARVALLLLLWLGLWAGWRESLLALISGGALVLISVTSHAAQASPANFTAIGAASDGLHLLTGGFWIGGLAVLANLYGRGHPGFAAAVARFAQWGMIAVTVLILTGMLNAATILLGSPGPDAPLYVAVLGAKLVLVGVMVGLALINHLRLLPRLAERGTAQRLAANIGKEFTLGLVVVGLAALLALLPPTVAG